MWRELASLVVPVASPIDERLLPELASAELLAYTGQTIRSQLM
jgi:hypothetical protein